MSTPSPIRVPHLRRALSADRGLATHPTILYTLAFALPAATLLTGTYTCPIHQYLHLLCPGCGATRALLALFHGHLHQALHLNVLFTTLLPVALAYAAYSLYKTHRTHTLQLPTIPRPAQYALLTLAALFTLARNL